MDIVRTENGYVTGTVIGEPGNEVYIYRGIPYAAPPLDNLRWKPPAPAASWSGIRECTDFSKSSPQSPHANSAYRIPVDEDCLYVNVLTPAKTGKDNLPVMVWMHGGGYEFGSGNALLTNSCRLPQNGIVLVTVNMRLNVIGLLAHPLLSRESGNMVSGNYMFLDMIAALKWVNRNIGAFGGNPDNVTIFGESGGGAKVADLMLSPMAKGLFHRAICESGTSTGDFSPGIPLKDLEAIGEKLFAKLGADREKDPLAFVRSIHWEKIQEHTKLLLEDLNLADKPGGFWDAAIDGMFLSKAPLELFRRGEQHSVPLITCANYGEIMYPGSYSLAFLIPGYVEMLSSQNRIGAKSWACIFDQVPDQWRQDGVPSTHAMELSYVFGDWDNKSGSWPMLKHAHGFVKSEHDDPGLTDIDKRVSMEMMKMWVQFAKTGNPNVKGLIEWPAYELSTDEYLYISDSLEVRSGFSNLGQ